MHVCVYITVLCKPSLTIPRHSSCLQCVGQCDIIGPDVKLPLVKADDSAQHLAGVNTHTHSQVCTHLFIHKPAKGEMNNKEKKYLTCMYILCCNGLIVLILNPSHIQFVHMITKESELHHSIGSPIDGAHPGPKTDRDYLGRYSP